MSDSDVEVKFGASVDGFTKGMGQVRSGLAGLAGPIGGVATGLGSVGAALKAAFVDAKDVDALAGSMGNLGVETQRAADILGTSTKQIGYLDMIAAASNISLHSLVDAFATMDRNLASGSAKATAALADLHISINEFKTESPKDQLTDISKGLLSLPTPAQRGSEAFALLGQAGTNLLPMLNKGPAAIESWAAAAKEAGIVFSNNVAGALTDTRGQVTKLNEALSGWSIQTLMEFRDAVNGGNKTIIHLTESFTQAVKQGGWLKDTLDLISAGIKLVEGAIVVAITGFRAMWSAGTDAFDEIYIAGLHCGRMIGEVVSTLATGFTGFFSGLATAAGEFCTAVGKIFENLGTVIGDALHGHLQDASAAFAVLKINATSAGAAIGQSLKASVSGFDFSKVTQENDAWNTDLKSRDAQMLADLKKINDQSQSEWNEIWGLGKASPPAAPPTAPAPQAPTQAAPPASTQTDAAANAAAVQAQAAVAQTWKTGDSAIEAAHARHMTRMAGMERSAGAQSVGSTVSSINAQIGVLRDGLRRKKVILDAQVAQHQISASQEYGQLEVEAQKEYEAELALLDKEKQIANLKPAQIQAINNKIEALQAQHDLAMTKLDEQSIAASQKQWQNYFNMIQSGFNGQIKGLIQGTTNWTTVFKSELTDLIVKFIETVEKMVFQWAAGELAKTTATTAGTSARTTAVAAGAASGAALEKASTLTTISGDAAKAAAGAYSAVAQIPIIGPVLAPVAAGVAYTAVEAFGSFDKGSWQLPSDMFAQVHRGEMIVPAAQTPWAQSLMSHAAGGGAGAASSGNAVHIHPTTNFHVSAVDSGSVAQWMKSNSGTMMKAMDEAVRHGAHLGLRRLAGA